MHSRGTHTAPFVISPIPNDPSPADIAGYRDLRLAALKSDPACFGSTYSREAAFDDATWRARITGSGRRTVVAHEPRSAEDSQDEGAGRLVGSATVIAARAVPGVPLPAGAERTTAYFVFGMWVRPEWRQHGVGRMLLTHALDWVAQDAGSGEGPGRGCAVVWLEVAAGNGEAKRLYERAQFEYAGVGEHGGVWMSRLENAS
ncbi:acyl-CoA N-acyltransferase [Epithele typhae]|uniref:acyl-CoA N-acyltransferase n=1 Tax=Epithele typhae TaxID=378194 RepID=UPI00200803A8|nr:acyl-CoA N-acyltransferase [Epithele typhae]KAH9936841.1 acyl-CoA N-acyltransferase [Epithele typhae]